MNHLPGSQGAAGNAPAATTASSPIWTGRAAGVLVFLFLVLVLMLPGTTLWDRDEPLYARAAVEMAQTGSWLVPSFNGEVFALKPPLIYWLMALSIRVFGVTEFAVRIVSAIGLVAAGWLTFLIGRRLFNAWVGFWAMAIFLTSLMSMYLGAAAMLDAVLMAWITLAIWAFVELIYWPGRWPLLIPVFGLALALAQLTKGPVGPVIAGSMVVSTAWFTRKLIALRWPHYLGLVITTLASFCVFLAWAIPADAASHGEMLRVGVMSQIIRRIYHPMEGHGGSGTAGYLATLLVYVPVVVGGFFPWTLHLPGALSALAGGRIGSRLERTILWAWMGPAFVLFSLAATKLPHYIFPVFPALALTTAAGLEALREGRLSDRDRVWFRRGVWFFAPLIFSAGIALLIGPWFFLSPFKSVTAIPSALALLALGWFALREERSGRFESASRALLWLFPAISLLVVWTIAPLLEPLMKISPAIAREVRRVVRPETPVYLMGYTEPSLVFYLNRPVNFPVKIPAVPLENLAREFEQMPSFVLISTREYFAWASQLPLDPPLREVARFKAINTNAHAKQEEVIVSSRGLCPSTGTKSLTPTIFHGVIPGTGHEIIRYPRNSEGEQPLSSSQPIGPMSQEN